MTSRLCSQSHPEEEPGHGARKLIQAGPGNQLAEGSGHLWDEPPTFTNQCLLSCFFFFFFSPHWVSISIKEPP